MKRILLYFFLVTMVVYFSCSEDNPIEPVNNAPEIQNVSADPTTVKVNDTTSLSCAATDADGDNLTTTWSAGVGSFPNGTDGLSVQWKAPDMEGVFIILVTVDDGETNVVDSISINVTYALPCQGIPTVTYTGKTYNTVQIGAQCWLKENLDVGIMIQGSEDAADNSTIEKYCYDDEPVNCETYGGLYQWNEMMQYVTTEGSQGICPDGWHLPSDDEWKSLEIELGMDESEADSAWARGTDQGTQLKVGGTSGFNALMGGYRNDTGDFKYFESYGYFWASTPKGASALRRYVSLSEPTILRTSRLKEFGHSVRCLKD